MITFKLNTCDSWLESSDYVIILKLRNHDYIFSHSMIANHNYFQFYIFES